MTTHRRFPDEQGRQWDVWEVRPGSVERRATPRQLASPPAGLGERRQRPEFRLRLPDHLCDGWLAFETDQERRRLVPIPSEWPQLTQAEMQELLERAEHAGAPPRLAN